jgi:UDPglucose--hexose-1-phosphate uridylyltransferase
MELRKDPITRSWVVTGDEPSQGRSFQQTCPFCPESPQQPQVISSMASVSYGPWSARAVVHPQPLFHVEGDPGRRGVGLYDVMRMVGAHEVIVENARHDRHLWNAADAEIEQFLLLCAQRLDDLKHDERFKYVSIFKDFGALSGQEFDHPTTQIQATTFVPRRVLYELRSGREHYVRKERCVFCDILTQEMHQRERIVEIRGDYVACCPYASRAPYECWIMPAVHDAHFERTAKSHPGALHECAALLRRMLNRIRSITDSFHLAFHTAPNTRHQSKVLNYWRTLDEDYHWHIEILPILQTRQKSYSFKETYLCAVMPEEAAARLREAPTEHTLTSS